MLGRASIPLHFWHCSWIAKLQKWRIKEIQRIHDGIVCGATYSRANCDHVLNFQRKKISKAPPGPIWSSILEAKSPTDREENWDGPFSRSDVTALTKSQAPERTTLMAHLMLSHFRICFFLILLVPIKSNPTGKCPFIANSWLNIMSFPQMMVHITVAVVYLCLKLQ